MLRRHKGRKAHQSKALVDAGAAFTCIPRKIAEKLNLEISGEKVKVSTAKGYDELDLTHALIEIDDRRRIMPA